MYHMPMMVDQHGRLVPSPGAIGKLAELLERMFGGEVDALMCAEQAWSASGAVHWAGIWRATGTPVLIKRGMNANQLYWTQQVAAAVPDVVPVLYASGDRLGELAINWTILERVPYGPLGPQWNGDEFQMLLRAALRFQAAGRTIARRHIASMDSERLRGWLEAGLRAAPPGPADRMLQHLAPDWAWVSSVCASEICHGDVHMCNALTRTPPPLPGAALLIDCQPTLQPWAFDAAYPQILNSIDKRRVGYTGLVPLMYRLRLEQDMAVCRPDELDALEHIVLAWYAIRMWGLCPDRHAIADYRAETERYIRGGVQASAAVRAASLPAVHNRVEYR